jgi:hypothetical protein
MFELLTIALLHFFNLTAQPTNAQIGGGGWGNGDIQQTQSSEAKQIGGGGWGNGDIQQTQSSETKQIGGGGWGNGDIVAK